MATVEFFQTDFPSTLINAIVGIQLEDPLGRLTSSALIGEVAMSEEISPSLKQSGYFGYALTGPMD